MLADGASAGSVTTRSGSSIATSGTGAAGVRAVNGARVDLIDTVIDTTDGGSHRVIVGSGATVDATNVSVTTTGQDAMARWRRVPARRSASTAAAMPRRDSVAPA